MINPHRCINRYFRLFFLPLFILSGPFVGYTQGRFSYETYPQGDYVPPLDTPLALSGSFGEVRPRHFHAGTDYRTQGREGLPVYAVMDGTLVRVNVSPTGYGLALYIAHPNGSTSVYGHLQSFSEPIAKWVKEQQYKRKRYAVQLYPPAGLFKVKRGEIIALSGNSGSSGGPHLHFELRFSRNSVPYNSAKSGISHQDNTPPLFKSFYYYDIDPTNYEISLATRKRYYFTGGAGQYRLRLDTIPVGLLGGFGVENSDIINANSLTGGINELQMVVNGDTTYRFSMQQVAFDETRYAEAHVDYDLRRTTRRRVALLFQLPGNGLSRYDNLRGGYLSLAKDEVANVEIIATDMLGNSSTLRFIAKGTGKANSLPPPNDFTAISHREGGRILRENYSIFIPPKALYYDIHFTDCVTNSNSKQIPLSIQVHNERVPLFTSATLQIKRDDIPPRLRKKAYLASVNGTKTSYATTVKWKEVWAEAKIARLGQYTLQIDTIPPVISPKSLARICNRNLRGAKSISLRITDGETSLAVPTATIDGKWALLEWDPKKSTASYLFDSERITQNSEHTLRITAEDAVGNVTTHECPFTW